MLAKVVLLGLVLHSPLPAGDKSGPPAPGREAVDFNWTQFGRKLGEAMPKDVKGASTLRQTHYVSEQVADRLCSLGIQPNFDQAGRDRAQQQFHDSSLGTCGHTATCLMLACHGAGIPSRVLKSAVVVKRGRDGQLVPGDLNADHVAMTYLAPEGPVVFDLWCDGRTQRTFAGFRTSIWKGIPLGEWARRMSLEHYTGASCGEHPELGEVPPLQMVELFRRIASADPG